jgi:hypothetical protein
MRQEGTGFLFSGNIMPPQFKPVLAAASFSGVRDYMAHYTCLEKKVSFALSPP